MDTEQTSADGVATGSAALGRTGGRAWSEAAQARGSLGVQWAPQPGRVRPGQAPAPRSPQPGRILWASAETAGRVTVPPSRPACDCPAATRSHLPRDPLPPLSAPFGGRLSVQHRKASLGFGHVQALGASDACFPGEVLGPLGGGAARGGPGHAEPAASRGEPGRASLGAGSLLLLTEPLSPASGVPASGHAGGGRAAAEGTARCPGALVAGRGEWEAPPGPSPGVAAELV